MATLEELAVGQARLEERLEERYKHQHSLLHDILGHLEKLNGTQGELVSWQQVAEARLTRLEEHDAEMERMRIAADNERAVAEKERVAVEKDRIAMEKERTAALQAVADQVAVADQSAPVAQPTPANRAAKKNDGSGVRMSIKWFLISLIVTAFLSVALSYGALFMFGVEWVKSLMK